MSLLPAQDQEDQESAVLADIFAVMWRAQFTQRIIGRTSDKLVSVATVFFWLATWTFSILIKDDLSLWLAGHRGILPRCIRTGTMSATSATCLLFFVVCH